MLMRRRQKIDCIARSSVFGTIGKRLSAVICFTAVAAEFVIFQSVDRPPDSVGCLAIEIPKAMKALLKAGDLNFVGGMPCSVGSEIDQVPLTSKHFPGLTSRKL